MKRYFIATLLVLVAIYGMAQEVIPSWEQYYAEKPADCYSCCQYQYHYERGADSILSSGQFDVDHVNKWFWIHKDDQHATPIALLNVIKQMNLGGTITVYDYNTPATFGSFQIEKGSMLFNSTTNVYTFDIQRIHAQFNMSQEGDYCVSFDYSEPTDSLATEHLVDSLHTDAIEAVAVKFNGTQPGAPLTGDVEFEDPNIFNKSIFADFNSGQKRLSIGWTYYGTMKLGCFDNVDSDEGMIEMDEETITIGAHNLSQYGGFMRIDKSPGMMQIGSNGASFGTEMVFTDSTAQLLSNWTGGQSIELFNPPSKVALGNNKLVWMDYIFPLTGSGAPSMNPDYVGQHYHDQSALPVVKIYEAVNTNSPADWIPLN